MEAELLAHVPLAGAGPRGADGLPTAPAPARTNTNGGDGAATGKVPSALARMLSTKYTADPFALVPGQLRDTQRRARDRALLSAFIEAHVDVVVGGQGAARVPPTEQAAASAAQALMSGALEERAGVRLPEFEVEDAWASAARAETGAKARAGERRAELAAAAQDRPLSPAELAELFAEPLPGFKGTSVGETLHKLNGGADGTAPVTRSEAAAAAAAEAADEVAVPVYVEELAAARDEMLRQQARAGGVPLPRDGESLSPEEAAAAEDAEDSIAPFLWSRSAAAERGSVPTSGGIPLAAMIETSAAAQALGGMLAGAEIGGPTPEANPDRKGVIPVYKARLFTDLVNRLTQTMTHGTAEHVTAQVVPQIFDKVTDVGKRVLPDSTTYAIAIVLEAALPLTVGTTVPELLCKLLPTHLIRRGTIGGINTIGRAVTHALTHTLIWALGQSPLVHYYCYYCKYHAFYCEECHGTLRQGTPTALVYGEYYASYYGDYFGEQYGSTQLWIDINNNGS